MKTMSIMGVVLLVAWSAALAGDDLSFERRIEAQRAIERLYYSHQTGATAPFEQAVPRELLEKKVRTYLTQSMALEEFWGTPVTAEALRHELERIAANTRFPGRLQEIYGALGHDPILIQETFVRPVLVDRLARSFFSTDQRIHGAARREAEALRAALLRGEIDPLHERDGRSETWIGIATGRNDDRRGQLQDLARIDLPSAEFERRRHLFPERVGDTGPVQEESGAFVVRVLLEEHADGLSVATYSVAKTTSDDWWSGFSAGEDVRTARTLALDLERLPSPQRTWPSVPGDTEERLGSCADEFWDNGSLDDLPDGRRYHTAVWTGSLMIVWGGQGNTDFNTGARYDPLTDTWSSTSTNGAPSPRRDHAAIWTGSEMIVWGGRSGGASMTNTGGRYDPLSDTWTATSTTGAASSRALHTAVWTGSEMVVWGGWDFTFNLTNAGGRYDPVTDTWVATSTIGAPVGRYEHTTVWTGSRMVIWGGADDFASSYNTGGRYDPATDSWTPTSMIDVPEERAKHSAVWTGSRMVVWGGDWSPIIIGARNTGGQYDPVADTWTATTTTGAPSSRFYHTAVWTGSRMVVWGGGSNTGGRYDPDADAWTPTAIISAPASRSWHTAIWTGDLMIVWGGSTNTNTGGRYNPVADSWTPTSSSSAPSPQSGHTAVWTGTEMIVWGGANLNLGGRYDPLTDSWSVTSTFDAPSGRSNHTAVWTGTRMIVWGGENSAGRLNSGGRYDPLADSWIGTITIGAAPSQRSGHSAVWTGSRMLIWGGRNGSTFMNNGSSYDPAGNTWEPMSLTGVPSARSQHTAVWTGSRMVIWGGGANSGPSEFEPGGRYDPNSNSWSSVSTTGAPSARMGHTAVWTGDRMVIWGAAGDSSGGRYDPSDDSWLSTSLAGAPSPRASHTAVWTGSRMLIWGGSDGQPLNTGGNYDPVADLWTPISLIDAPSARGGHSAVWTGNHMIVWSGNGGRYHPADGDGDGMTICSGDCDDAGGSIHEGAPDLCDGLNNDCGHPSWPALVGTVDMDDDGDALSECSGDCDDTDVTAWAVPGTVPGLTFSDQSTMTWTSPEPPGGTAPLYDTLRAALPDGFSSSLMCVEQADAGTTSTDAAIPGPGEVAYYLVRAQNVCGTGGTGAASDSTPRVTAECP